MLTLLAVKKAVIEDLAASVSRLHSGRAINHIEAPKETTRRLPVTKADFIYLEFYYLCMLNMYCFVFCLYLMI